jgi:signal transduction histidine kinase
MAWRRETLADVGFALGSLVATVALIAGGGGMNEGDDPRGLDLLAVPLVGLATLPLAFASAAPFAVFVLCALGSISLVALGYPVGPPVGATVALFLLALRREESPRETRLIAVAVPGLLLLHLLAIGLANDRLPWAESVFAVTVWGGAWFAGDRTRLRRERVEALQERALRAEHDAARERRLAASEERMRIARDLHDSAGHAINVILVHAGAARLNARRDLGAALTAIETIEEVARETVTEIDRIVGALREGDELDLPVGLDALDTLLERHRAAGLDVTLERRGDVRSLPRAVDRTAFRILQEALTNAAKHGDGHADAELVRDDGRLEITVRNGLREPVPPAGADHHGIVGMRERAGLLGGTLEAGADAGIYTLRARLPVERP